MPEPVLSSKIALVTGGGSGIGAATCRAIAEAGGTVAVLDIDGAAAESVAAGLLGGRSRGYQVDVSDSKAVDRVVDEYAQDMGRLDILVHAAGIDDIEAKEQLARHAADDSPAMVTLSMSDARWDRMIAVHLGGAFFCVRAALRHMVPQHSGAIVLISSTGGIFGVSGYAHYAAAKGGMNAFGRSVATEVIASGVRVNVIAPGVVDTPMHRRSPGVMTIRNTQYSSSGRAGQAEEIAKVVVFLASDDASFVVGETMIVNGGRETV